MRHVIDRKKIPFPIHDHTTTAMHDQPGYRFVCFGGRHGWRSTVVRSFVQGGEHYFPTRGMIVSPSVIVCTRHKVRHPRGSYIVYQLLSLEVSTPENESINWALSSICKKVPLTKRFLVGRISPFTRLAQHLTALHAWCKQCLPS